MLYFKILMVEAIIMIVAGLIYSAIKNRKLATLEKLYLDQWECDHSQLTIQLAGMGRDDNNEKPIKNAIDYAKLPDNIEVRCYGKE